MEWKKSRPHVFWGEIAPHKHVVQFYEDEQSFLDVLTGYVGTGINAGDTVIIIATRQHIEALNERLLSHGIHLNSLIHQQQYIPVVAEDLLIKFMVNGMPDARLFDNEINLLLRKARHHHNIKAFAEMVALLIKENNIRAAIAIEELWNKVCLKYRLSLFCAYPTATLKGKEHVFKDLCDSHTKIITTKNPYSEILYHTRPADKLNDRKDHLMN